MRHRDWPQVVHALLFLHYLATQNMYQYFLSTVVSLGLTEGDVESGRKDEIVLLR